MARLRIQPRVTLFFIFGARVSASALPGTALFDRAASCAPNYNQCPQGTLPGDFCCPSGQNCLALAGASTLLCCPSGQNCSRISPISCDLSLQDASKHPDAVIKTTAINGLLDHCGDGTCCPFGYTCGLGGACLLNADQSTRPPQTTTASTSTSTSSQTSSTTSTAPTSSDTSATSPQNPGDTGNGGGASTAVIAGASVAAAIVVIALAFLAVIFFRRRNRKLSSAGADLAALKLNRSSSSFGNIISHPIVAPGSSTAALRTDFARGRPVGPPAPRDSVESGVMQGAAPPSPLTPPPPQYLQPQLRQQSPARPVRLSSIAYGYGAPATSPFADGGAQYHAYDPSTPAGRETLPYPPDTPRQDREPSSMSINIFADPSVPTPERGRAAGGAGRYSNMTTFSDMLRSADLGGVARGEPYLSPTSNQGSPGSRIDGTPASRRR